MAGVAAMVAGAMLIYFVFGTPRTAAAPGNRIVPTPAPGGTFDPSQTDVTNSPVALAQSQVGKRYLFGALSDPTLKTLVYDCSSLMQSIFAKIGKTLPRTSQQQSAATTPVTSPQPGDLAFGSFVTPNDHVGIYIGNGQVISALDEAHGVVQTSVTGWPGVHYGRVQ